MRESLECWEGCRTVESHVWRMWQLQTIQMSDEATDEEQLEADTILRCVVGQGKTRRLALAVVAPAAALVSRVLARLVAQDSDGSGE